VLQHRGFVEQAPPRNGASDDRQVLRSAWISQTVRNLVEIALPQHAARLSRE